MTEGRGPRSRIVCCGLAVGGLGRVCRGRRGVGSLVGGRLSSWSLAWGEWLGEHGECSADRFVGFGDWYGHVFGDGYVVVGAGCAFGVPCVGVGPLHGGSGAWCACRVVHGGKGFAPEPVLLGEEGCRTVGSGAFGSLTGGAEHGPGLSGRYGCSGCCGTEVFAPVCVSAIGGHDHAVARRHYVCSWSKVRGEQDFLSDGNCAHGCALSLLLTGASAS